jgi:hypothetical protein
MIVESHWRRLKHDYLHRFNRPRIDLVVWVLISRVIPDAVNRMQSIHSGEFRIHKARWRGAFKRQWRELSGQCINTNNLEKYRTNPLKWVCACDAFLYSRFLICKRILQCYEPIQDSFEFFETVCRQRTSPFWIDNQLILRPEYKQSEAVEVLQEGHEVGEGSQLGIDEMVTNDEVQEFDSETSSDSSEDSEDDLWTSSDESVDESATTDIRMGEFRSIMQSAMDIFNEQGKKGNMKFIEKFIAANEMM